MPAVKGHGLRHQNGQAWCACGHYIAGLGAHPRDEMPARERHELHVAAVIATAAAARTVDQDDLFNIVDAMGEAS